MDTLSALRRWESATQPTLVALVALVVGEALISTVVLLLILRSVLRTRRLLVIAGRIRALSGPFEALGIEPMVVAGLVFVSLSSLKFLAAWWLANGQADGAVLQLCLLGASAVFWYGFAVPYGPVLGIPQLVLLVVVWPSLTQYGIASGASDVDDRVPQHADPLDRDHDLVAGRQGERLRRHHAGPGHQEGPPLERHCAARASRPGPQAGGGSPPSSSRPRTRACPRASTESLIAAGSARSSQATMHGPSAHDRS